MRRSGCIRSKPHPPAHLLFWRLLMRHASDHAFENTARVCASRQRQSQKYARHGCCSVNSCLGACYRGQCPELPRALSHDGDPKTMRHARSSRAVLSVRAIALILFAALFTIGGPAGHASAADAGGLVNALTSQLGVTKPQAEGGAGALFNLAKQRMAPEQFGQVQNQVPGIDSLMGASSAASSSKGEANSGGLGGIATGALGSVGG